MRTTALHEQFADLLRSLSPEAGLGELFREIVRDVWKRRHGEAQELRARVAELEASERELTEAYAVKGAIDESAYTALLADYRTAASEARVELDRFSKDDLDEEAFGTAVTAPIFGWLGSPQVAEVEMVTPWGFEPQSPG